MLRIAFEPLKTCAHLVSILSVMAMSHKKLPQKFDKNRILRAFFLAPPIAISTTIAAIAVIVIVSKLLGEVTPLEQNMFQNVSDIFLGTVPFILFGTILAYFSMLFPALPLFLLLKNRIYIGCGICMLSGLLIGWLSPAGVWVAPINGWLFGIFGAIIGYTFWRIGIRTIPEDAPTK